MSRRTTAKKRLAVPDPIYNSRLVTMLTVRILQQGKKHLAQRIIYQALDIIKERTGEEPLSVLENAVRKVTPLDPDPQITTFLPCSISSSSEASHCFICSLNLVSKLSSV